MPEGRVLSNGAERDAAKIGEKVDRQKRECDGAATGIDSNVRSVEVPAEGNADRNDRERRKEEGFFYRVV